MFGDLERMLQQSGSTEEDPNVVIDIDDVSATVVPDDASNEGAVTPDTAVVALESFKERYLENYQLQQEVAVQNVTVSIQDFNKPTSRCPVYITQNTDTQHLFATAYITGNISDIYDYLDLIDLLNVMQSGDVLHIFIDSPGGYVATGAHIASCIDTCKGKVVTIARGFCASAASLIWSAGHVNELTPFSVFMYHMSSHVDMGNSFAIMSRAADMVRYVEGTLLKVPFEKGHITKEELDSICAKTEDKFIDAKEMASRIQKAA